MSAPERMKSDHPLDNPHACEVLSARQEPVESDCAASHMRYDLTMSVNGPSLSREGANLQRSVMRELLRFAVDPNVISLAGGLPASEFLPLDQLGECLDAVLSRDGPRALQYSPQYPELRAWIADYMGTRGVSCTADEVFITSGNQNGLTILSRLFLEPRIIVLHTGFVFIEECRTECPVRNPVADTGALSLPEIDKLLESVEPFRVVYHIVDRLIASRSTIQKIPVIFKRRDIFRRFRCIRRFRIPHIYPG